MKMRLRKSGVTLVELIPFYGLLLIVMVSGLVWLYFDQFVRVANEIGINHHPLQAFTLSLHGVFAWIFLFLMGWILGIHLRFVWPLRRRRKSGLLLSGLVVLMCSSGFALYYLAAEDSRAWTSSFHWVSGVIFVVVLLSHVFLLSEPSYPRRKK